jgi:hypothetical protein
MFTLDAYRLILQDFPTRGLKPRALKLLGAANTSVCTGKKAQNVTIRKTSWLMLFAKRIAFYSENHTIPINGKSYLEKYLVTDC